MAMYLYRPLALSVKGDDKIVLAHFHNGTLTGQKDDPRERLCLSACREG
jgi:hypothetical protein